MQLKHLAIIAAVTVAACRRPVATPRYIPPEPRPIPSASRIGELIDELPSLEGYFTEPFHVYALVTDHRPIAELASADIAAIPRLVECLRDDRAARIRYQGQRVAVGMVCAYVLLYTRYVERRLQYSCFHDSWRGLVSPALDQAEIVQAWREWQQWLARHPLDQPASIESPNDRCS